MSLQCKELSDFTNIFDDVYAQRLVPYRYGK